MAITLSDFDKIWASTSPLTPYSFSDNNYKQGWNFVGSTPPARQMWDFLQKQNDEKTQWLYNNKLSLSGGTMTGDITLADGGVALSNATVGTIVTQSASSSISLEANTAKTLTSISLTAGTWVINGHAQVTGTTTTAASYGVGIGTTANDFGYGNDGTASVHSSNTRAISLNPTLIMQINVATTVYLCGYGSLAHTVAKASLTAVRIV